jgi:hypothetical protein
MASSNNPYDFIANQGGKKGRLAGGGSMKSRIIIVVVAAAVLLIIGIVLISLLSGSGGGLKDDYTSLVQQQAELIRIGELGTQKARQAEAKNLAYTVKLSLASQQGDMIHLAKKAKADTSAKSLALGRDSQTDAALTAADQSNRFDSTFITTMQAGLQKYQQALKKVYDQSTNKTNKALLSKAYDDVGVLIGNQSTTGGTSASPATN